MKRRMLYALLAGIVIIAVVAGVQLLDGQKNTIDITIMEGQDHLDQNVAQWIESTTSNKGIHLFYVLQEDGTYNYWLYFNKNSGENLYYKTRMNVSEETGKLKIWIAEDNASNDSEVKDHIIAKFGLQKKPDEIDVYYNGAPHQFDVVAGSGSS
ncbi:hypothetical protein [Paenibacillus sp. SYP-B4298]|uniref:hypothetical protein n=1 Tax=Paenibacillus sp. SYP-B4298 TaxID=2996034 RepID=UPI0022DD542F|nr:hypothetical protein [Paenibacillus sp. SYP-B4298]